MNIEIHGTPYNRENPKGLKAALRAVNRLRKWLSKGNRAITLDDDDLDTRESLDITGALSRWLRSQVKRVTVKGEVPKMVQKAVQHPRRQLKPNKQQAIDIEISRLMHAKLEREDEEQALIALLMR